MTPSLNSPAHALHCHPATPAGQPLRVTATAMAGRDGLQLVYEVLGRTEALHIPPGTVPGPADGLWQHTCLEAFVGSEEDPAYTELNFSPSGQWAVYRFSSERVRSVQTAAAILHPQMATTVSAERLMLKVDLPWAALPSSGNALRLGLSAVIEEASGTLSYWALQHPRERPDFHHPAGRVLRLALPAN